MCLVVSIFSNIALAKLSDKDIAVLKGIELSDEIIGGLDRSTFENNVYKFYNNKNKLILDFGFKNDKLEGEYKRYHENGNIAVKSYYKNGKSEGEHISHYENGKIQGKKNYKDGKVEGESIKYYESGKIQGKKITKMVNLMENIYGITRAER
jgi:antitoxin component YwqK of YwqJK toxin-antitoxin module